MKTYKQALEHAKSSSWSDFFKTQDLDNLMDVLDNSTKTIYPSPENIFRVFDINPQDIKVVILSQDPYYNPGQAMGLAFSVNPDTKTPKSLTNIFKELKNDLGIERTNPDLSDWHKQGVFLLNTALSVPQKETNKHKKYWKNFTNDLLQYLTKINPNIVYIMWRNNAKAFGQKIEKQLNSKKINPLRSPPITTICIPRVFQFKTILLDKSKIKRIK